MPAPPCLLWFRRDLRLADNPALAAALARGRPIIPFFILDDEDREAWPPGAASRWWLHHSLDALDAALRAIGSRLILARGPAAACLDRLIAAIGADAVFWNRLYDPALRRRDAAIKTALRARGITAESRGAQLLFEPWEIRTASGSPYRVFTPFWRALRAAASDGLPPPDPAPSRLPAPETWLAGAALEDWALRPRDPDWAGGLRASWSPGESGARRRAARFLDDALPDYAARRDLPGAEAVSALSPHLHFGEIGPRQLWHAVAARGTAEPALARPAEAWLRQLAWRDFSWHLLHHAPDLPDAPLDPRFAQFEWWGDPGTLAAWRRGRTGYPLVDAGMRQLWHTGWMHNRVRMIAASFLIKDLGHPWQIGARWFWDTLVDADLANNSAGWQWVAGSGADAAPFFRIFNPVTQGRKFDPDGSYVRRWVPELAALPDADLHAPWAASPETLRSAGIRLGESYPHPIVDHAAARIRALAAFEALPKRGPARG